MASALRRLVNRSVADDTGPEEKHLGTVRPRTQTRYEAATNGKGRDEMPSPTVWEDTREAAWRPSPEDITDCIRGVPAGGAADAGRSGPPAPGTIPRSALPTTPGEGLARGVVTADGDRDDGEQFPPSTPRKGGFPDGIADSGGAIKTTPVADTAQRVAALLARETGAGQQPALTRRTEPPQAEEVRETPAPTIRARIDDRPGADGTATREGVRVSQVIQGHNRLDESEPKPVRAKALTRSELQTPHDPASTPVRQGGIPDWLRAPEQRARLHRALDADAPMPRVEVRIGRVEVRAVQRAADPEAGAQMQVRSGPATSLDEYLKQREAGS
jgi:hypothetical protein